MTLFGCSRPGNLGFANLVKSLKFLQVRRITMRGDMRAHNPAKSLGFSHVGTEYWIRPSEANILKCFNRIDAKSGESLDCENTIEFMSWNDAAYSSYWTQNAELVCSARNVVNVPVRFLPFGYSTRNRVYIGGYTRFGH